MNRPLEIIKEVRNLLLAVHPRVWPERAPDGAQYPYLIIALPNAVDQGDTEVYVMDVDGWDAPANGSPAALEQLMHLADQALQRKTIYLGGLAFTIYRDNRLTLEDDDRRIRRRKYIYQVRVHGHGGA